jgi:sulfite reductase (ferredoxin)
LQFKKPATAEKVVEPAPVEEAPQSTSGEAPKRVKDLRGVACPMNFVRTKLELASLQSGDLLEVLLDDGQPINNVPGSVRNEGHQVLKQEPVENYWKVVIRKK